MIKDYHIAVRCERKSYRFHSHIHRTGRLYGGTKYSYEQICWIHHAWFSWLAIGLSWFWLDDHGWSMTCGRFGKAGFPKIEGLAPNVDKTSVDDFSEANHFASSSLFLQNLYQMSALRHCKACISTMSIDFIPFSISILGNDYVAQISCWVITAWCVFLFCS